MRLSRLVRGKESLIGLDIGVGTLKVVELERNDSASSVIAVGGAATPPGVFEGSLVTNPRSLGRAVAQLLETARVRGRRAAIAVPGSSIFSKRLRMPRMPFSELSDAIRAEAAHFIPDDVAAIKLDFHILGTTDDDQVEVLVVAVREEIVAGFLQAAHEAQVEVVVVDVDCFALQNCFEAGHQEACERTVGLIDVGSTVSSINICHAGNSLFTGDMSIGVGAIFDDLSEALSLSATQARNVACSAVGNEPYASLARDMIDRRLEALATECNRQLNFYWKAAGSGGSIDHLVLSGGGACVYGIADKIHKETGISTEVLDPFKGYKLSYRVELGSSGLKAPLLGVAMGLAIREVDDRLDLRCLG